MIAHAFAGWILERTGQFFWPFLIAAAVSLIGAFFWIFILGPVEQVSWAGPARVKMDPAATIRAGSLQN